jgi:hypothetical protein
LLSQIFHEPRIPIALGIGFPSVNNENSFLI